MSDLPSPPERTPLGRSGLFAAPIGWGMWRFKGNVTQARRLVEAVREAGVTLFDTADIYGYREEGFGAAERLLGLVLRESPGLRDEIVLASKGGISPPIPYDSSALGLVRACEASLQRLGVERIDLYQIHRPDLLAHPAEAAEALTRLHAAGKIQAAGVSNYTPAQTAALQAHLPFPLASVQPEFSPLAIQPLSDGVLDQAMERGYAVLAWSPLAQGRLAEPSDERARAVAAALDRVAARFNVSRAATAFAWVLAHPARPIPLVGTQRADRIRDAADALKVRFTREDWYAVLVAARGAPMP